MLGDEMSEALWDRLHAKLSGDTCPGCRQKLDRTHTELQPCEKRVLVKCTRCDYIYLDNGHGVIIDVDESDLSSEFETP